MESGDKFGRQRVGSGTFGGRLSAPDAQEDSAPKTQLGVAVVIGRGGLNRPVMCGNPIGIFEKLSEDPGCFGAAGKDLPLNGEDVMRVAASRAPSPPGLVFQADLSKSPIDRP